MTTCSSFCASETSNFRMACVAWMVKRSEILNLGGLWVEGHGLPE